MTAQLERIYIGGLDPYRGLTVELVVRRLCLVSGVEIISVNDAPIKVDSRSTQIFPSIYNTELSNTIDQDGNSIDRRNFFFLEARSIAPLTSSGEKPPSALELLMKQYHNTKWKGCQIRVESAKPHFLKRLEQERAERTISDHPEMQQHVDTNEIREQLLEEEYPSKNGEILVNADVRNDQIIKNRRRLRIRKHFGDEAFHVDTHPHQLEIVLNQGGPYSGWDSFVTLKKRMSQKHFSQIKKIIENRREERKIWLKGEKKRDTSCEHNNMRSMMFLNRGIHVRFTDEKIQRFSLNIDHKVDDETDKTEVESIASTVVSAIHSLSDSEKSTEEDNNLAGINKEAYLWSDDDESASGHSFNTSGDSKSANDTTTCTEFVCPSIIQPVEFIGVEGSESNEKLSLSTCNEEKKVVRHANFDDIPKSFNSLCSSAGESNSLSTENENDEVSLCGLDDDIRSNLAIFSKMFPGESINEEPLKKTSMNKEGTYCGDNNTRHVSPSYHDDSFSSRLILQRYDPTKICANRDVILPTHNNEKELEANKSPPTVYDSFPTDSYELNKASAICKIECVHNDIQHNDTEMQKSTSADEKVRDAATSVNEDVLPEKDIYEQKKLENIFRQAREVKPEVFSLASLFENIVQNPPIHDSVELQEAQSANGTTNQTPETLFSFDVSGNIVSEVNDDINTSRSGNSEQKLHSNQLSKIKVRLGSSFPTSVVDQYEDMFFSFNNGSNIIQQWDSQWDDKQSQDRWQKEREVLTADWKRKQKSATSKRIKRVRKK